MDVQELLLTMVLRLVLQLRVVAGLADWACVEENLRCRRKVVPFRGARLLYP